MQTDAKALNWKGALINRLSTYRAWYDKGIAVLSVLRNMQLSDLGILMAVVKYLFSDHISTTAIIMMGVGYWIVNMALNLAVGWFWERNNGWELEARILGQRVQPSRTVLVSPGGKPYDAREVKHAGERS